MFDVPDTELAELILDDDRLLLFAMRFLRRVLFGGHTLPFTQGANGASWSARKSGSNGVRVISTGTAIAKVWVRTSANAGCRVSD